MLPFHAICISFKSKSEWKLLQGMFLYEIYLLIIDLEMNCPFIRVKEIYYVLKD